MADKKDNTNNEIDSDDCDSICTIESDDSCMQMIQFESIRSSDGHLEEAIVLSWPKDQNFHISSPADNKKGFHSKDDNDVAENKTGFQAIERYNTLRISTLLEPDSLAPLFSGAEWAGTRVWHAAIRAMQYLDIHYSEQLQNGATLLELGCGLGVPGMIAYQMGANVVVTDQPNILSQLVNNVQDNFYPQSKNDNDNQDITSISNQIHAKPLSWSRPAVHDLIHDLQNTEAQPSQNDKPAIFKTTQFDFVLNCDCVFEPLYGESWKLLAEVIDELLGINPQCIVLTSMERRNFDGIEKFLDALNASTNVSSTRKVHVDEKNNIELYVSIGI